MKAASPRRALSRIRPRWLSVAALGLAGITCLVGAAAHQGHAPEPALTTIPAAVRQTPPPTRAPGALVASPPILLAIPSLAIRSTLLDLGLASDGSLAVPPPGPRYDRAGWYTDSPEPGSPGPAVIVGHVDSAANGPSVFFRLGSLRPGASVLVTRADGSVAHFAVRQTLRYHKSAFPTQLVYGNTSDAELRLITCGGVVDHATGHYLDNIIVTAVLTGVTRT